MSLAKIFVQQITGNQTGEHKASLIEELAFWNDPNAPFYSMGVIIGPEEKEGFVEEIKELMWEHLKKSESSIEDWFWMYYLADILEFEIPADTREKKLAKFFLDKCVNEMFGDIENYISTIRLI